MSESSATVQHEAETGGAIPLTDDLAYIRQAIVNAYFFGRENAGDRQWVLIDTGIPGLTKRLIEAAEGRFGEARPAAIVLTHGHVDHVGGITELADKWDVPVYAHELELPYLTGRSAYPPPEPAAGGGLFPLFSTLLPKGPIDLGSRVRALPADGAVPGMPGWRWIHTPGHTPGHVSLWRSSDRALVAGDAVVTTRQESIYAVITQRPEINRPPAYFTADWDAARESARAVATLEPELLATGHGRPMHGAGMRAALHALARDFDEVARSHHGRYADEPALANDTGVISVPPPTLGSILPRVALGLAAGLIVGSAARAVWKRVGGRD